MDTCICSRGPGPYTITDAKRKLGSERASKEMSFASTHEGRHYLQLPTTPPRPCFVVRLPRTQTLTGCVYL